MTKQILQGTVLLLTLTMLLFLPGCSPLRKGTKAKSVFDKEVVYFSYNEHQFYEEETKKTVLKSPVKYKADQDLRIGVIDYNPIRTQISLIDTASKLFLEDEPKLSSFLTTKLGIGASPASKDESTDSKLHGEQNVDKNGCKLINSTSGTFKSRLEGIHANMNRLKELLSKYENISLSYQQILIEPTLTPEIVSTNLQKHFLAKVNTYLKANEMEELNADPNQVLIADLEDRVNEIYKKITIDGITPLEKQLPKSFDIKKCGEQYLDLKEKISAAKLEITEYRSNYEINVAPKLAKLLVIYDGLYKYLKPWPVFKSKPFTMTYDEHIVKINSKNIGESSFSNYDQLRILPAGGVKLDLSAGFFVSGLHDDKYIRKSMDSVTVSQYVQDGKVRDTTTMQAYNGFFKQNELPVSIGGALYLHIHSRNGSSFNWGGSLGFGALFNDQARLVLTAAPSLIFGKKQRFVLSPGLALGQVERLSQPYNTGVWYKEVIDNVPTYKAWKLNWSLGLSWNL